MTQPQPKKLSALEFATMAHVHAADLEVLHDKLTAVIAATPVALYRTLLSVQVRDQVGRAVAELHRLADEAQRNQHRWPPDLEQP